MKEEVIDTGTHTLSLRVLIGGGPSRCSPACVAPLFYVPFALGGLALPFPPSQFSFIIKKKGALAGLANGLEGRPVHQKVAGSIPGRGAYGRQPIDVSLSHRCISFSLSFSQKKNP